MPLFCCKKCCGRCRPACKGPEGLPGPHGPEGPQGQPGICECKCEPGGELLINGGMEAFYVNIPDGWFTDTPGLVSRVSQQGRVHSGESSVDLRNGANLFQEVLVKEGCFYKFSFFAHAEGAQAGVTAYVVFMCGSGCESLGLKIAVRQGDLPTANRNFTYFNGITIKAPKSTIAARVYFAVMANGGQSVNIDNVSFS